MGAISDFRLRRGKTEHSLPEIEKCAGGHLKHSGADAIWDLQAPAVLSATIGGLWRNLLHFLGALFRTTAFLSGLAAVGWVWFIRLRI